VYKTGLDSFFSGVDEKKRTIFVKTAGLKMKRGSMRGKGKKKSIF
jgi:hypothetical protein